MIISRNNKPKFKLQTAYDTLTSRLRGLGYDVDGNIELDTSGYGHGWIKVLRNGRKNNFIYMCSHSDNVDPLCCEPVYRYIKVYNYCDDPKDSNLLGEIPFVVSNINEIPNMTEVYKDDEYKVYKNTASDIVWGFMNLDEGHVAQAPWTPYPTTIKSLSGEDIVYGVPTYDIIDNKAIKLEDGSVSAFDDLFEDDDTLYLGQSKEVSQLYTWNSYISGAVYSETLNSSIDKTICPYCFGSGEINNTPCTHCTTDDDINVAEILYKGTYYERTREIPLVQSSYDELIYNYAHSESGAPFLLNGSILSVETTIHAGSPSTKRLDQSITAEKIKDNNYKITYCLHKLGEAKQQATTLGGQTFVYRDNRIIKREFITTLSKTEYTTVKDTFIYKNLSNITVEINLPPIKDLVEATYVHGWQTGHSSYLDAPNTIIRSYLHAYMKGHKDPNGEYENIMVHVNDDNSKQAEILNYMLHSKVKTFEYSPFDYWNYDEIMNFILYKDENLQVLPTRNGVYHLKTNYYNELKNNSEIAELENVLDGNTCMHLGYLGDNAMHNSYDVILDDDKDNDISYLQAYPYIKNPFKTRYNYFPNNEVHNIKFLKTPDNGFFEGIFQYHNDQLDALPDKYVWLTMKYGDNENNHSYEGNIDTAEIRKPYTDKKWEWQNNFHNFLTQREVKGIYYKESFSACDTLSAISGLRFDTTSTPSGSEYILAPTTAEWTQAVDISNDFFRKNSGGYYVKGDGDKTCYDTFNNISWNGLSAYRHVCRTCSGIGMVNPFKLGCDRWYYNKFVPSDFKNFIEHSACCPTCARTGVQTRYLYYKHKYVKPLANYGYSAIDNVNDDRVTFGNQILLPDNLIDDDLKKDLIIYTTSADPVEYYEAKLTNAKSGNDITYKLRYLGYNQMYSYADVSRDANENPQYIMHWSDIPNWNKMTNNEKETTKKQWTKRLYRVINPPDKFVQYYVFKGHDNAQDRDAWSRIFFDKKWIEKQYFENNTLENPNQYVMNEVIINKGDHNHNHVSEITHDLTDDRSYPYYGTNSHDRRYELDYRKNGVLLQHTCPVCNGEGTIQTFKTDDQGEIIYDITGKAVMIDVPCPTCNENGYLEDTHREDYNTAKCSTCNNEGHITCPKCLGTGVSYAAKDGYTLEIVSTVSSSEVAGSEYPYKILELHFKSGTTEMIQFYKYVVSSQTSSGIRYKPDLIKTITAGEAIDNDYVYSIACPNCSRYTDLDNGQIPCPECGGTFKQGDDYYRIAPGNEDNKKVYKYISINAVSIDNISIEMDNGI